MRISLALFVSCLLPLSAKDVREEKVSKGSDDVYIEKLMPGTKLNAGYQATDTTYFLHVPDDYNAQRAYPLILAVSPGNDGAWMYECWKDAAKKYPLLFACPNQAGNPIPSDIRGQRIIDTLTDVLGKYNVDREAIYVSGFSGGGRMSTATVHIYPGYFAGHIPMGGIFSGGTTDRVKELNTKLGVYLFAGETCFNRKETELAHKILKEASIPVEIMIGTGMDHKPATAPQGLEIYEWFAAKAAQRNIGALKEKAASAEKAESAGELGKALAAWQAIAATGIKDDLVARAVEKAKALEESGRARFEKAKGLPAPEALAELAKLAGAFSGTSLSEEAGALREKIAADPKTKELAEKMAREQRAAETQAAFEKAAALEKSGDLLGAKNAFEQIAQSFADTALKPKAEAEAARLAKDPRLTALANKEEAEKLFRRAENFLRNNMQAQAKEIFMEIATKYPGTEFAERAKEQAAKLR